MFSDNKWREMGNKMLSVTQKLVVSSLLAVSWMTPVLATQDQPLNRAELYKLIKTVELLLQNKTPRKAELNDVMVPRDAVRTGVSSEAQLFFNDKSLIRVDQRSIFRFEPGVRRFQLPNRIALNEMIFKLENGTALILSPPGSVGTEVETPGSKVSILAINPVNSPNSTTSLSATSLFSPAIKPSAVMIIHDAENHHTQVFALTDGDIKISDQQDQKTVNLKGGQTVAVRNGLVGKVQEFDLQGFYKSTNLSRGLAPGQENLVAQEAPKVQETINFIRTQTLAALRNQTKRIQGFTSSFLSDALGGTEGDLNPRFRGSVRIRNPQVTTGTFYRTEGNNAIFIPENNSNDVKQITVDFDKGTVNIGGNTGISNNAGLSGNNARGSVINANGQITQIEVFGVNGEEPQNGIPYSGSLTTGVARDR